MEPKSMELVERYLQAIGRYLPAESRADILAELRTELLEQMDARAEEWGRPLDEADIAALLRVHGRPEAIALRYLPQRSLIGPSIFPLYLFTLRRALPLVLIAYTLANAANIIFASPAGNIGGQIASAVFRVIPTLFMFWGIVTIVFAGIDYARTKPAASAHLDQWNPLKLPALKPQQTKQKSFATHVMELVFHVLWMLYVLAIPAHPFIILGPGAAAIRALGVGLAPVWHTFYVLYIAMLCVQLLEKVLALRSGEQALLKPLEFVADVIGLIGLSLLAFARQFIVSSTGTAHQQQQLATVNHALSLGFRVALFFAALGLVSELWKYFRGRFYMRASRSACNGY